MLQLLNLVLAGCALGFGLMGLVGTWRYRQRARLWVGKSIGLMALVVWLLVAHTDIAGFVALPLWLLFVALPAWALGRSVRWVMLEDYDKALAKARLAQLLHPGDGIANQVELQQALRGIDEGRIDEGLAVMRDLDARHPGHEFYFESDARRFHGDWQGVRTWMDEHLDETTRNTQPRHSLLYLQALGETGDLEAMLDFYTVAAPALRPLKSCLFPQFAQLALAVAFGRRQDIDALLTGPMKDMAPDAAGVCRAAARMTSGEVEQGRAELLALRPDARASNQAFIDRWSAREPAQPTEVFGAEEAERRYLEAVQGAALPPRKPKLVRIVRLSAILFLLTAAAIVWGPWRSTGPLDADGRALAYLERVVGDDSVGLDPETPLPMLIDIHGYGAFPEIHGKLWEDLDRPVRLILPTGPDMAILGRSWYPVGDDDWSDAAVLESAGRLAHFIEQLARQRPTVGAPLVTGFSQGGVLSFVLATHHPDAIGAAFPVGGWLPQELLEAPWPALDDTDQAPVHAFHGGDDGPEWPRKAVDALQDRGRPADLSVFEGVGHSMDKAMKHALLHAVEAALPAR